MPITVSGFKSYFDRVAREEDQAEVKRLRRRQDERAEERARRETITFEQAQADRPKQQAREEEEYQMNKDLLGLKLDTAKSELSEAQGRAIKADAVTLYGATLDSPDAMVDARQLEAFAQLKGIKDPTGWSVQVTERTKDGVPITATMTKDGEEAKTIKLDSYYIKQKIEKDKQAAQKASGGRTGFTHGGSFVDEKGNYTVTTINSATGEVTATNLGPKRDDQKMASPKTLTTIGKSWEDSAVEQARIDLPPNVAAVLDKEVKSIGSAIARLNEEVAAIKQQDPESAEIDVIEKTVAMLMRVRGMSLELQKQSLPEEALPKYIQAVWEGDGTPELAPSGGGNPFSNVNSSGGSGGSGLGGM